jgi:hypothetical protein
MRVSHRPPSTITGARLRTVNETFQKVLEKDRALLTATKKRAFEWGRWRTHRSED